MDSFKAAVTLSALAHEGRLTIFRTLVQAGAQGVAAGDLARLLGIAPNTLSASLTVLFNAGLVTSRREGRSVIYTAAYARMTELLGFLMEDCCQGRPEICAPLADMVVTARCETLVL